MSSVRVLVGTRKGAFVLSSDGKRKKWKVSGPHFAGWEIYHMKGSPVDPNRIYASQTSGWFGQILQRSDDGGKTWNPPGGEPCPPRPRAPQASNKFAYDTSAETGKPLTTHQWYDGTQHPWEFKRVWHLEPSLTDPNTVYAGVEDAALFRSTDGGASPGTNCPACAATSPDPAGSPAPAACACTPSSSIPPIPTASSSPSPPREPSAPTMAAPPGSPSIRDSAPNSFPTPTPKSATACITSPCIPRAPTCSSCRSTGT